MIKTLGDPVVFLKSFKDRVFFAVGMFAFLVLFIIFFNPFNIYDWLIYLIKLSPLNRLSIVGFVLICAILIGISQYLQYRYFQHKEMKVYHVFMGFGFEVLLGTLIISILYATPSDVFFIEFLESLRIILLLLSLWYIIGLSILALYNTLNKKEEAPLSATNNKVEIKYERINICDENAQLRLSLKPKDLLYFESADNYIIVHYYKNNRLSKELVRNSLKNIESEMKKHNCIRCHRSYIINLLNVSSIKKNGRMYEITIEGTNTLIPISRGYIKIIKELLAAEFILDHSSLNSTIYP